jgi:sulfate adenylyltransferase
VHYLFHATGDYYVGGAVEVLSFPLHADFKQIRRTPEEIRLNYKKLGWNRVVGFITRNPIHRPQFEMTLRAMREAKANLLLLPIDGTTKPEDFDHYTRVRCYNEVAHHYPPGSHLLNLLPLSARMAGPKTALMHAIIAKNYGCTHFIIGRDHAGPGLNNQEKPFYVPDAAQTLVQQHSKEINIAIIPFTEMVYLPFEDEYRFTRSLREPMPFHLAGRRSVGVFVLGARFRNGPHSQR